MESVGHICYSEWNEIRGCFITVAFQFCFRICD